MAEGDRCHSQKDLIKVKCDRLFSEVLDSVMGTSKGCEIIQSPVFWLEGVKGGGSVTQTLRELGPWG